MDARIGVLNSGKYYAYVNGYDKEPVVGTLEEVEVALGLRPASVIVDFPDRSVREAHQKAQSEFKTYSVLLTFEFPAWDEVEGIEYRDISARSKSDAIKDARRQAERDGHAVSGKGKYWFKATEQEG